MAELLRGGGEPEEQQDSSSQASFLSPRFHGSDLFLSPQATASLGEQPKGCSRLFNPNEVNNLIGLFTSLGEQPNEVEEESGERPDLPVDGQLMFAPHTFTPLSCDRQLTPAAQRLNCYSVIDL